MIGLIFAGLALVLGGGWYIHSKEQTATAAAGKATALPPPAATYTAPVAAIPSSPAGDPTLMAYIVPFAGWRDASGNLRLLTAVTDQENKILTYMKQNKSTRAPFPADVAHWLVTHGIDPMRTA